jgi:hypothetical protein
MGPGQKVSEKVLLDKAEKTVSEPLIVITFCIQPDREEQAPMGILFGCWQQMEMVKSGSAISDGR